VLIEGCPGSGPRIIHRQPHDRPKERAQLFAKPIQPRQGGGLQARLQGILIVLGQRLLQGLHPRLKHLGRRVRLGAGARSLKGFFMSSAPLAGGFQRLIPGDFLGDDLLDAPLEGQLIIQHHAPIRAQER
jgi:hypothetical protein